MKLAESKGLSAEQAGRLAECWCETVEELVLLAATAEGCAGLASLLGVTADGARELVGAVATEAGVTVPKALPPAPRYALGLVQETAESAARVGRARARERVERFRAAAVRPAARRPERASLQSGFSTVRNQGQERGTCVAFASVAAREFALASRVQLSEEFLYCLCKLNDGCPGESGTSLFVAAGVLAGLGICRAETWPYDPAQRPDNEAHAPPPDAAMREAPQYRVGDALGWQSPDLELFLDFLLGFAGEGVELPGRPLVIGLPLFESVFSPAARQSGKLFGRLGNEAVVGGHALLVVGYQLRADVPGGGYLICRNSWGTDWGTRCAEGPGHALVSFRYLRDAYAVWPVPVVAYLAPEELRRLQPARDPVMAAVLAEAEDREVARLCAECITHEALSETVEECRYREDASLELRRVTQRDVVRLTVQRTSLELPRHCLGSPELVRGLLESRLHDQFRRGVAAFAAGETDLAALFRASAGGGGGDRSNWVRCFLLPGDAGVSALEEAGIAVTRPFRNLDVLEALLPPVAGLADALEERIGVRCCPAGLRIPMGAPSAGDVATASAAEIQVAAWFPVEGDVRERLGRGVRIGIADTGIDLEHPDVAHVPAAQCRDFAGGAQAVHDPVGHGTHCAGIAAGRGVGCDACVGVAPLADLVIAKVFDDDGWGSADALFRGLDWLVDQRVNVLSLSLGTMDSPNGRSRITRTCDYIAEHHGILVCVSAGNDGPGEATITCPGDGQQVITVAALDAERRLADFSSRGGRDPASPVHNMPDVAGPGVRVVSCRSSKANAYFPPWARDPRYTTVSGTSMACPAVAGVCALLWSAASAGSARERAQQVTEALFATATVPRGPNGRGYSPVHEVGHGVPDVRAALQRLGWRAVAAEQDGSSEPRPPGDARTAGAKSAGAVAGKGGVMEEEPVVRRVAAEDGSSEPRPPGDGDARTAGGRAPAMLRCDWSGLPISAGAVAGRDYFLCEGPDGAPVAGCVIARAAWERYGREAGGRRWTRAALRREYLAYVAEVRGRAAVWGAGDWGVAHAGFIEWVRGARERCPVWLQHLAGFLIEAAVAEAIEAIIVRLLFGRPFFVEASDDTSPVAVEALGVATLRLRGAKGGLLGRRPECGLAVVVGTPAVERVAGAGLAAWRERGLLTLAEGPGPNGDGGVAAWLAAHGAERVAAIVPESSAVDPAAWGVAVAQRVSLVEDGGVFAFAPEPHALVHFEPLERRRRRCIEAVRAAFVADRVPLRSGGQLSVSTVSELERAWGRGLLVGMQADGDGIHVVEDGAGLVVRTPRPYV